MQRSLLFFFLYTEGLILIWMLKQYMLRQKLVKEKHAEINPKY